MKQTEEEGGEAQDIYEEEKGGKQRGEGGLRISCWIEFLRAVEEEAEREGRKRRERERLRCLREIGDLRGAQEEEMGRKEGGWR